MRIPAKVLPSPPLYPLMLKKLVQDGAYRGVSIGIKKKIIDEKVIEMLKKYEVFR